MATASGPHRQIHQWQGSTLGMLGLALPKAAVKKGV